MIKHASPHPYIAERGAFVELCRRLRQADRIALDTEFIGEDRFTPRLEIVQIAAGAEFDLMAFMISQYFGQRSYGIIYSVTYAVFKIAAGIGPLVFGYSYDINKNYDFILYVAAAVFVTVAVIAPV